MTNEYIYFLESNFVGVNRLFVLNYSDQDKNSKTFKAKRYLTKGIFKNYNIIIHMKNFNAQLTDSDIKRYKGIRKLTTGHGENYTTGCLLDYHYIKNY